MTSATPNSVIRDTLFGNNPGIATSNVKPQANGDGGVSENITAGAYASSADPSQRLGWYLGGMQRNDSSLPKYPLRASDFFLATDEFYQADMTDDYKISFTRLQSPPNQAGLRAQGGLVWLPFGKAGILVALGGVQYPGDLIVGVPPVQQTNNTYMSDMLVYDIDGRQWYTQSTLGSNPGQLAGFCTAVVPTKDGHSQQIIVYGGYDGTGSRAPSDDVWMLSVPAFQWTQIYQSRNATAHGRKSALCFAPNPTTLITVGGTVLNSNPLNSDTFIDVFNLNSLSWGGTYDPSSNKAFSAPSVLTNSLQWPNADGPGSFSVANVNNQALRSVLTTNYTRSITPSYPYAAASSATTSPTPSPSQTGSPKPGPNIPLIASLATIIPLLVIAAIIAFCCLRRRNRRKQGIQRTQNSRSNVHSWLGGSSTIDPVPEKSLTSTETAVNSPSDYFTPVVAPTRKPHDIHQLEGNETYTPQTRSPGFSNTAVGSPSETYEIMTHEPRGNIPLTTNPYHPPNHTGQHSDVRSEATSDRHLASELPHDRSQENLSVPSSGGVAGATQPSSISRKPVADRRGSTPLPSPTTPNMGHVRGTSDVSSAGLTASPNTDFRRSQHIDGLPDHPGLAPPATTQGRSSVYKEKFDDDK